MQVGTMSFSSDHPHKEYGELYEWDDTTSKLTGSSAAATTAAAATQPPPPPLPEQRSRSPQLRRLSSRRYSEMSMDLCDLQDWLDEEGEDGDDSNNSRIAYNNYSISTASDHSRIQNQLDCVQETDSDGEDLETDSDDDDDDDDGFAGSGEYSN